MELVMDVPVGRGMQFSFQQAPQVVPDAQAERVFTAISLFSGGGGLDVGMEAAGFHPLACVERDPNACLTLKANQGLFMSDAEIMNADVTEVDLDALMARFDLSKGDLDVLYGGPPCQTFSQIGKKGGLNDERGKLLFTMVDYARALNPKLVVIENVKALLSAKNAKGVAGGVVADLVAALRRIGYHSQMKVLNAADYGVAQKRQRLFIVASRIGSDFSFPHPILEAGDHVTVGEVIQGLPDVVGREDVALFPNHIDVTPAGDQLRISYVEEGSYLACMTAPAHIKGKLSPKDTTKFLRTGRDKTSNTLRCGEVFFHPLEDRYLTPREYMRIHGFPDSYVLQGPVRGRSGSVRFLDQHRQVANSVPPPVAAALGRSVARHLVRHS